MQSCQVVRIVGEVGIHLEDILIVALQGPLEAGDVSRAKTQLACPLYHEQAVTKLRHERFHDVGGAVGAVVVDNQNIERHRQVKDIADNLLDVLFLLVSRDDDQIL